MIEGKRSKLGERLFIGLCWFALVLPLAMLATLLIDVAIDGSERLSLDFLRNLPSRRPERAGILLPLFGTAWLMVLTAAMALPIGVGSAIYLEEYGKNSRIARAIETNIANLAGVPSVIYGLLGLEIFVRTIGLGRSLLAGAATLSLLILPIVIIASREALRTVPYSIREGGAIGENIWIRMKTGTMYMVMPV